MSAIFAANLRACCGPTRSSFVVVQISGVGYVTLALRLFSGEMEARNAVWGQPLSRTSAATAHVRKGRTLKVWVNGKAYTGDPAEIALTAHEDIVIEAGPPFPKPKAFTTWGNL